MADPTQTTAASAAVLLAVMIICPQPYSVVTFGSGPVPNLYKGATNASITFTYDATSPSWVKDARVNVVTGCLEISGSQK